MMYASDMPTDSHLLARGYPRQVEQPGVGAMMFEGPAFHATSIPEPIVAPAPALGEHTREICRTILRMDDAEVSQLVAEGVLEEECRRLNEGFFMRVTRGRPFVTLKLATSLDGRIAAVGGDARWISSPESRELVHRWRREADAVMVGAATVLADNPRLTCRTAGGRDPARVIIDGRLRLPASAKVFRQRSSAPTILVTTPANRPRAERLYGNRRGARSIVEIVAAQSKAGKIDLNALMREFGRRGWSKILLEGGAHLAGAALAAGIVDRVAFFIAPRILGGGLPAVEGMISRSVRGSIRLGKLHVAPVGDDLLIEAEIAHPPSRKRRKSPV